MSIRPVVLYITMSVDGFIADTEGGVGWLAGAPGEDYGYAQFYEGVDAVLLGRKTYEQILGFDVGFPYADKPCYVFSSDESLPRAAESVEIVTTPAEEFVARLKLSEGGPIWLGGGARLATTLWDAGLVDEMHLFNQPIVLGGGIPLFSEPYQRRGLELLGSKSWPGGLVEVRYRVLKEWSGE